ncbi:VOC family protein [Bacillus cereus]|uniref:VOC family protein n=1 Tax=Bacillus cereus TaxID=1396 RepID=UPI001F2D5FBE|nr:VOC family protein [Bacillus cereus]BCC56589.1 hypothetical protein BCJMU07_p271 [Bacillus cereus]BCD32854.1 hypothetical protein BC30102_p269 [Bacillus cereus]HDR8469086.1 VOC family protein [Bacillus cereus]
MAKIKRIETVFIRVSNLKKAIDWYKQVFDLSIKWETKKAVALKLGETDITLVEENEIVPPSDSTFNLFTDDIKGLHSHIKKLDIPVSEIKTWNKLRYLSFYDKDQNKIEVCNYNKIF